MSCEFCSGKFFKKKLGRCQQCMWINFFLLLAGIVTYFWVDVSSLLAVQQIALLMFLLGSSVLMALHLIAWSFYRIRKKLKD